MYGNQLLRLVAGAVVSAFLFHHAAMAHEGHGHAPGTEDETVSTGPIVLNDSAIANLGIQTEPALLVPQAEVFNMPAQLSFVHTKESAVSARFAAKVLELHVREGEKVNQGDAVVTIQPLAINSQIVTLRAPIAGAVISHDVVAGQAVMPETVLYRIADTTDLYAHGIAYESPMLMRLAPNQKVILTTKLVPGKTFQGRVHHIGASLDQQNRTFNVYALIDNRNGELLANTQANLSVEVGEPEPTLTVPAKAVLGELGEYFLFVREGNTFERRTVTLGRRFGTRTEILEGVLPDEQVVVQGSYQLQYVKPKPPEKAEGKPDNHDH